MKKQGTRIRFIAELAGKILVLVIVACIAMPGDASALKESRRERVRRQIHEVKTWEMTKELSLDEEQAGVFFPAMNAYESDRVRLRNERDGIEATLDSLLAAEGTRSEREILKNLERLKLIDREQAAREDEYQRKLSRILTPQQRARYELFERNFDTRLRKMIREIQREDDSGAGPSPEREKTDRFGSREKSNHSRERVLKKANSDSEKKDKSKEKVDSRKSKSRTGDKDKSDSKKSSEDRPSRGRGTSWNFQNRTEGPELPRRGEWT